MASVFYRTHWYLRSSHQAVYTERQILIDNKVLQTVGKFLTGSLYLKDKLKNLMIICFLRMQIKYVIT